MPLETLSTPGVRAGIPVRLVSITLLPPAHGRRIALNVNKPQRRCEEAGRQIEALEYLMPELKIYPKTDEFKCCDILSTNCYAAG